MGSLAELRDGGKGDGALALTTIPWGKDMGKRMKKMLTGRWGGAKEIVLQSMVAVAQLVESQVVALVAVGSSPTSHPIKFSEKGPVLPGLLFFVACLRRAGGACRGERFRIRPLPRTASGRPERGFWTARTSPEVSTTVQDGGVDPFRACFVPARNRVVCRRRRFGARGGRDALPMGTGHETHLLPCEPLHQP